MTKPQNRKIYFWSKINRTNNNVIEAVFNGALNFKPENMSTVANETKELRREKL